jgi:hypothetical protein
VQQVVVRLFGRDPPFEPGPAAAYEAQVVTRIGQLVNVAGYLTALAMRGDELLKIGESRRSWGHGPQDPPIPMVLTLSSGIRVDIQYSLPEHHDLVRWPCKYRADSTTGSAVFPRGPAPCIPETATSTGFARD